MDKKIQSIEMNYIEMFSKRIDKPYGAMFEDSNQRDKHMHNILFVNTNSITPSEVLDYLDYTEQYGFSNILFDGIDIPKHINKKLYQITPFGYYGAHLEDIHIKSKRSIECIEVHPRDDDEFFEFVMDDDQQFGKEYAKNNHKRLKTVLLNNQHRFHYYKLVHEGMMIGHINVFYEEDVAKIDEFYVLEPHQRQGFGISMLSNIIEILKEKQVKYVYLITNDMEQTKYLYQSIGMKKISSYYELKIKTLDLWD